MGIKWSPEYAIDVEIIDNQHKELFSAINNLLEACNQGKGKEEAGEILKFLENYVVEHFKTEEEIQKESGFPEYEAHKKAHDGFIQSFTELKKAFAEEGATLSFVVKINKIVVDWLIQHVTQADKRLGVFLKEERSKTTITMFYSS